MAKITDLQRLRVIDVIYSLLDKDDNTFIHPIALNSFKISFGIENKKTGEGRVRAIASFYDGRFGGFTFTFYGVYNHLFESCRILSVLVDREFKSSVLLSVNNLKINGLWLLGEEEDAEGAAATDSVVAVSECRIKSVVL